MKTMKRLTSLLVACGAISSLSGCAYFNVGEEEFSCSGMPDSVYCHSARDVYEATNGGEVPSRVGPDGAYNEKCDDCVRSEGRNFNFGYEEEEARETKAAQAVQERNATEQMIRDYAPGGVKDEVVANYVAPRLPGQPVPIRTPAVVMRIWIAPYIDENDDLNAPGYVFTEIEPRRWIYGENQYQNASAFTPLLDNSRNSATRSGKQPGFNSLEKLKEKQKNANL